VLTVPAQTPPCNGEVRFVASGPDVQQVNPCKLPIVVRPLDIRARVMTPIRARTYVPRLLHRWLVPTARTPVFVKLESTGEATDTATVAASWSVAARSPDGQWNRLEADDHGRYEFRSDVQYRVVLFSPYKHAQFSPSQQLPLAVEVVCVSWPWWCKCGGAGVLIVFVLWRCWPVKVVYNGRIHSRMGRLHLGRLVGNTDLKLKLTRRKLRRGGKECPGCEVEVRSPDTGCERLMPGDFTAIHCGDTILVRSGDGCEHEIEVIAGRPVGHRTGREEDISTSLGGARS
jgi:hypothetical protein